MKPVHTWQLLLLQHKNQKINVGNKKKLCNQNWWNERFLLDGIIQQPEKNALATSFGCIESVTATIVKLIANLTQVTVSGIQ